MTDRERLFELVREVLSGRLSVAEFDGQFYGLYLSADLENIPGADAQLLSDIQEKLDLSAGTVGSAERRDGWVTHAEFLEWLRDQINSWEQRSVH